MGDHEAASQRTTKAHARPRGAARPCRRVVEVAAGAGGRPPSTPRPGGRLAERGGGRATPPGASPSSFMYSSKPLLSTKRHLPTRSWMLAMVGAGGRAGRVGAGGSAVQARWLRARAALYKGGAGRARAGPRRAANGERVAPGPRPAPARPGVFAPGVG